MPSPELQLIPEAEPDEATIHAIATGLEAYNNATVPGGLWAPLWIVGRDETRAVRAGLRGVTEYDWLFVNWL